MMKSILTEVTRYCVDCGLEANSEEELESFVKNKRSTYGRENLCKNCDSIRRKRKRTYNDRANLLSRFQGMKARCYNPNDPYYGRYGGRGITICESWLNDPESFVDWALQNGFKQCLQIDRQDNDGGYSPQNCRFITLRENIRNSSSSVTDWVKGTRICGTCKTEKPFEAFHRSTEPGGRMYICRDCRNKALRLKRRQLQANPDPVGAGEEREREVKLNDL